MAYSIGIDWGTTNFRAYLINKKQEPVAQISLQKGLLSTENNFPQVLYDAIKEWEKITSLSETPVYMAGMVGSKQGWYEVPYISAPIRLAKLSEKLFNFELPWKANAFIVPGISNTNPFSFFDVMRGEETQLLGLYNLLEKQDITAILPGTHSKHAIIKDGKLIYFTTIMTGELFSILDKYSLLTQNMPNNYEDTEAFLKGVSTGYYNPLSAVLFSVRTLMLNNRLSIEQVRSYLSGLLIGNELSLLIDEEPFYIVGSDSISHKYKIACSHLNKQAEIISGEKCFINGISQISSQCKEK